MPRSFLDGCRYKLNRYRRSLLAWLGILRIRLRTTANQSQAVANTYRDLIEKGQIVWGAVVQANEDLDQPGPYDLPGNVVFSPSPHFDERPLELLEMASAVRRLKGRACEVEHDVELLAVATTISDELNLAVNRLLPSQIAGEHEAYLTWMTIHRSALPGGILASRLLPLLICPGLTEIVIVLPLQFWPDDLLTSWGDLHQWQFPPSPTPAAAHSPEASPLAFGRQPSAAEILASQPAATDFSADGVALTSAAAAVFRPVLEQQAAQKGQAYVYVALREGRERLEVAGAFDPQRQLRYRSHGIDILIDREQRALLAGTLIDFASSPYESGFKFLRLDAERRQG